MKFIGIQNMCRECSHYVNPEDMLLMSRPCTYVDFEVEKKNALSVVLDFEVSAAFKRQ